MRVAFDTSVLVAGSLARHAHAERARVWLHAARAGRILASARAGGADAIVTSCPLCQFNLAAHRPAAEPGVPLLYLGELLAWALVADAGAPPALRTLLGAETTTGVTA